MKHTHIKIGGFCLTIVFLVSMALAASSSATMPEFRIAGESKETEVTSKSEEKGAITLTTVAGEKIRCANATGRGVIVPPKKIEKIALTFTGCRSETLNAECKSLVGPVNAEEIKTNKLVGVLGYRNKAEHKVGLLLEPEGGAELWMEVECSALKVKVKVKGSIIGLITPVNKLIDPGESFTLEYNQAGGSPEDPEFEGGPENALATKIAGGVWVESALTWVTGLFPAVSTEIVA